MNGLLVDNYDSYTYNLFQLLSEVTGSIPHVVTNDSERWQTLDVTNFDYVVVSPGPGHPSVPGDVGRCRQVFVPSGPPVLGVCLGFQLMAHLAGAKVDCAPYPRHGYRSSIRHAGTGLFDGLPQQFGAVRYHSLRVHEPLPEELEPLAWAEDGILMALRHRSNPWWGVQFHPESIATAEGDRLIRNFIEGCRTRSPSVPVAPLGHGESPRRTPVAGTPAVDVQVRVIDYELDAESSFAQLFGREEHAVWLDSSTTAGHNERFSFLGAPLGDLGEILEYRVGTGSVDVRRRGSEPIGSEPGNIFDVLSRRLAAKRVAPADLPFPFPGGYVGYFGYELKADCGALLNRHRSERADAYWVMVDRLLVIDHFAHRSYLVALSSAAADSITDAGRWLDDAREILDAPAVPFEHEPHAELPPPRISWDREQYESAVLASLEKIRLGESYEVCLTTRARQPLTTSPAAYYSALRRRNPAPYAAFLRLGSVSILSSSPERFLKVSAYGEVESRPIKGTAPRSADSAEDDRLVEELGSDPKSQAENLMIVDLVRNDLGRVCEIGSVSVPQFMKVERYATVHQLVSAIHGRLRAGVGAVDAARACFPPGSMTGAPKLRTMEILDDFEHEARGIYSGALGYFALSGAADLAVVIRTAVVAGQTITVGAGGAIVADSDPSAEYEEMLLKMTATLGQAQRPARTKQ